ncbi:hypothetical protein [Phycisphaera mikurensis]|uniref:Uncharacterized protein n=1 Tax=Phycisphaera mikurensis (strain NBRC 102666 / KCTC 22515 / FYK2301M01) TaxID=1142394 RepID=I0IGU4_PHYMF|nr:hypothetical protein [Phycisphaera mikurensis]MBB6440739.1 hypothetical protein [Phycisphaera mikurensis]BAM04482.1 hypothetical protein PSMK_23230 [Phycisphaera mikurensis NBRC 102666]
MSARRDGDHLIGGLPLPLIAPERGGPWSRIGLHAAEGPARLETPLDAIVVADAGLAAGSTAAPEPGADGVLTIPVGPPRWTAVAPDAAPGAPRGDAAAFGQAHEDVLLASCYAAALAAAERLGLGHLGFTPLGRFHADAAFPPERAAKIALGHAVGHFARRPPPAFPRRATFLLADEADARLHRALIRDRAAWAGGRRRG